MLSHYIYITVYILIVSHNCVISSKDSVLQKYQSKGQINHYIYPPNTYHTHILLFSCVATFFFLKFLHVKREHKTTLAGGDGGIQYALKIIACTT